MKNVSNRKPLTCFLLCAAMLTPALSIGAAAEKEGDKTNDGELEQIIPITMANIRGHQSLYREGWFVITSTEKALRYAKEKSIDSSGAAVRQAASSMAEHSSEFGRGISGDIKQGYETGKTVLKKGTQLSGAVVAGSHVLAQAEIDFSAATFVKAWDRFIIGNIHLAQRTEEDRQALKAIPGDYFSNIKNDFSNLYELSQEMSEKLTPDIEVGWNASFDQARQSFAEEYEKSGDKGNSLMALGNITLGYFKAIYHGLAKPGAKAVAKGGVATVKLAGNIITLPTAGLFVVTGRTVQSLGLTLYYTTKAGIKVVSPTVEGGLLAGVSIASAAAVPVTYAAGAGAGLVNQVAVTAGAPVVATAQTGLAAGLHSAKYAGLMTYDLVKGGSKVVINQAGSGVVLGYNALTAIPSHLVLGAANSAFFLVYDGPRLVIAKASGAIKTQEGQHPVDELPVGSIVDMQTLEKSQGITLEPVSDDPEVINEVLQRLPDDLRH